MNIKIAYIGGGSKSWARVFMNDLALTEGLAGEISLYDIDSDASVRNQAIGMAINQDKRTRSHFDYVVTENIQKTLFGADFVIISILPGTFATMAVDVHLPERYGIWQPVGDTTGPVGVLRSMRTVPMFEFFAREIEKYC
ncbi:MAG: alpha-glucosidase/alpha-galactosidase, partial [Candidatus Izemoplasmatales bacterium]|nr:alpha-glucosidase/alpha-galactosidase [Candidatus Izemoplasmatales bacterium]